MDALILAAGEGSRLLPLTRTKPKPLFPILNRPLLQVTFDYLNRFSLQRVVLNTHHLSGQIEKLVQIEKENRPFEIQTRFEPTILGTGGGIGNTRDFWSSYPFVVINGDILTDIDLHQAVSFHQDHKGPVTLILHDYPEFNQISVDARGQIQEFRQGSERGLAFTGIHLLEKEIFDYLPTPGTFEIIPVYQRMIQEGIPVWAYISKDHYWRDMGTLRSYLKVHEELLNTPTPSLPPLRERVREGGPPEKSQEIMTPPRGLIAALRRPKKNKGLFIHPETRIEKGVQFSGWACIGKGCLLKKGCRIHKSVLWEDVVVESGVSVSDSILGDGVKIIQNIQGATLI
jgi:NDP-sugar pyrophosphorylase family protein